jgi:hypothetical protein
LPVGGIDIIGRMPISRNCEILSNACRDSVGKYGQCCGKSG